MMSRQTRRTLVVAGDGEAAVVLRGGCDDGGGVDVVTWVEVVVSVWGGSGGDGGDSGVAVVMASGG
ncbi:hypothetical protein Tco_0124498, partial [Tanacetum coccineum]